MRAWVVAIALIATPAVAQDETPAPTLEQDFVQGANLCLGRLLGDAAPGAFAEGLRPASDATRASHPLGDANLKELASRADGNVTVRAPDNRTCSVFAVGASPAASFELLATALQTRSGFAEQEIRRRQEGRVQRTFRSADGVRVEMEGFTGETSPLAGGDLAMVHMGRR
jgi:hypothetical protein